MRPTTPLQSPNNHFTDVELNETKDMDEEDDDAVQLSEGLKDIYTAGGKKFSKFSSCEINVESLFEIETARNDGNPNGEISLSFRLRKDADESLDLSCLDAFRQENDNTAAAQSLEIPSFFVPQKVHVRNEMQWMIQSLLTKSNPSENRTVLTGSPGIGKSVLLFLVALRYQLLPNVKAGGVKVAYMRKVFDERYVSLFLMEPGDQPHTVRVIFVRTIRKNRFPSLFDLWNEFRDYTQALTDNHYLEFVDGPKHDETADLLNHDYRFLCTSGGYPPRSQSEIMSTEVKVLSGWTEDSIVSFLRATGLSPEGALRIYSFSGGRVRLARWGGGGGGLLENGIAKIMKWFDELINHFGQEKVALAVTKTDSSASASSSDRLRTRFLNYDGNGESLLIVDSSYAMSKLRSRLNFGDFMSAFLLAGVCGLRSARGWFFEEILHLWFKKEQESSSTSSVVQHWLRSSGSGRDGVAELDKRNLYWIPSTSNFANIDAAIVVGSILVCLQYTVCDTHAFDQTSFWSDFASHVKNRLSIGNEYGVVSEGFTSIEIWFITPKGTNFRLNLKSYSQPYSPPSTALRSKGPLPTVSVSFHAAEVICESMETLNSTIPMLYFMH